MKKKEQYEKRYGKKSNFLMRLTETKKDPSHPTPTSIIQERFTRSFTRLVPKRNFVYLFLSVFELTVYCLKNQP